MPETRFITRRPICFTGAHDAAFIVYCSRYVPTYTCNISSYYYYIYILMIIHISCRYMYFSRRLQPEKRVARCDMFLYSCGGTRVNRVRPRGPVENLVGFERRQRPCDATRSRASETVGSAAISQQHDNVITYRVQLLFVGSPHVGHCENLGRRASRTSHNV